MAKWYKENEAPGMRLSDCSPILQVYQYGCENESKYLILSTGLYTWFLVRSVEDGKERILKISQTFVADQEVPCSLAQAFVCFILMALEDKNKKVPIPRSANSAAGIRTSQQMKKKKQDKEDKRSDSGNKRKSLVRKEGGGVVEVLLPLDEVDFEFNPIETYHAQHGVAHRIVVNDLDCVVKRWMQIKILKVQGHWKSNHQCTKRLVIYAAIFSPMLCSVADCLLDVLV